MQVKDEIKQARNDAMYFWKPRSAPSANSASRTLRNAYFSGNPSTLLSTANRMRQMSNQSGKVLYEALALLGRMFSHNSHWTASDRLKLTQSQPFKNLCHDLTVELEDSQTSPDPLVEKNRSSKLFGAAESVDLLLGLANLNYRPPRLVTVLLRVLRNGRDALSVCQLADAAWALAWLGVGDHGRLNSFECDTSNTNHQHLVQSLASTALPILESVCSSSSSDEDKRLVVLQSAVRIALSVYMSSSDSQEGPAGLSKGSDLVRRALELAIPLLLEAPAMNYELGFWVELVLHGLTLEGHEWARNGLFKEFTDRIESLWIDRMLISGQPNGLSDLQMDVDRVLRDQRVPNRMNISVGAPADPSFHRWICSHQLSENLVLEYNEFLPIGSGVQKSGGWLSLKSKVLTRMGFRVVVVHAAEWNSLSEEQKADQVSLLVRKYITQDMKEQRRKQTRPRGEHDANQQSVPRSKLHETSRTPEPYIPDLRAPELTTTKRGLVPKNQETTYTGKGLKFKGLAASRAFRNRYNSFAA